MSSTRAGKEKKEIQNRKCPPSPGLTHQSFFSLRIPTEIFHLSNILDCHGQDEPVRKIRQQGAAWESDRKKKWQLQISATG
ncbi:hypothetical protein CDAR_42571, partial [Caerostris darwini]